MCSLYLVTSNIRFIYIYVLFRIKLAGLENIPSSSEKKTSKDVFGLYNNMSLVTVSIFCYNDGSLYREKVSPGLHVLPHIVVLSGKKNLFSSSSPTFRKNKLDRFSTYFDRKLATNIILKNIKLPPSGSFIKLFSLVTNTPNK